MDKSQGKVGIFQLAGLFFFTSLPLEDILWVKAPARILFRGEGTYSTVAILILTFATSNCLDRLQKKLFLSFIQ